MSGDESSELSSAPSDIEEELELEKKDGILKFFSKLSKKPASPKAPSSPSPPPREPSPPHEYVLADNVDIPFIVMFRSRFSEVFPKSLANFGPQELERAVVSNPPGDVAETCLCALLGLLLNRKQDVKAGHYNRALEEAIQTHKSQWAKDWEAKNPLSGDGSFSSMTPSQRLTLLKTLILWTLSSSQAVKEIITTSYKQNRHEDDLNQPLSVQPWGQDSYRKKYYLIEGLDDTNFRIYKEGGGIRERSWWSVAGNIDELVMLADKLSTEDGGQKARLLATKMRNAIPRFEATEEKRKRREYRQQRKDAFKRPEPGFSMYEGRTRGKRMKYTYSDDEDDVYSDATSARRSTRNTGTHTPADNGPTVTASGRQVRSRIGGAYGESMLSGAQAIPVGGLDGIDDFTGDDSESIRGRPRRAAVNGRVKGGAHIDGYNSVDDMDEESDASEQDYGDDEEEDEHVPVESDDEELDNLSDADEDEMDIDDEDKQSLVVKLPVKTPTPERKGAITVVGLHGDQRDESVADPPTADGIDITNQAIEAKPPIVGQLMSNQQDDQAVPGSVSLPVTIPETQVVSETRPIDITKSHSDLAPSPRSPSLTFRGSPAKSHAFPPSIDVSQGGV